MSVRVQNLTFDVKQTYKGLELELVNLNISSVQEIVGLERYTDLQVLRLLGNKITKIVRHSEVLTRS